MLDANNFTFLIEFKNSYNGSFIVNTNIKDNTLQGLANELRERKDTQKYFDVFIFDRAKRKFTKFSKDRFKLIIGFNTELINELK